jgi:glycosyltransferase involved in cell wall biosynthesis
VDGISQIPVSSKSRLKKWSKVGLISLKTYDIIHTGGAPRPRYFAAKAAHITNPNIKHIHTFRIDVDCESKYHSKYKRKLANMADIVTAVSRSTAQTVEDEFGVPAEVIYNAVDSDIFTPNHGDDGILREMDISQPFILFVGSLEDRKNPKHVMKVADELPDTQFVIIGSGEKHDQLREIAQDMNNVKILGRICKSKLPSIYSAS